MPGMNQLPSGAEGAAAFSLTYAIVSLACSCTLWWLTLAHRERWSYIFLLAITTGISTVASISQQIHDIIDYEEIIREQFRRRNKIFNNPELAIANASYGVDLVLYYIQYYLYNAQALLVMFWAGELAQSVYGLGTNTKTREILRRINLAGKTTSFLLPLITILMLRSPTIQGNYTGFILVADLPLVISLAVGSGLICAILVRYIRTKKKITNWSFNNQQSSTHSESMTTTSGSTAYGGRSAKRRSTVVAKKGFHDRWLMVRFFVGFAVLACFEVTNALFQFQAIQNLKSDAKHSEPDLSAGRARSTFFLFLPGTTAGIFLFIVFGTTTNCRSKMCETLVPKSWRTFDPSNGWKLAWRKNRPPAADRSSRIIQGPLESHDVRSMMSHDDKDMELAIVGRSPVLYHSDLMKPLPPVALVRGPSSRSAGLNNHPISQGHNRQHSSGITKTTHIYQTEESHYAGMTDDSDDTMSILPIMSTNRM